MFLNKYIFHANFKESINVVIDGKFSQELHDVSLISVKDIRCVSEISKQAFKNPQIEAQIAVPFLVLKSTDKNISYLVTWAYKDLEVIAKVSDTTILDELAKKYKNELMDFLKNQ